ncbi:putative cytochrome P450 4aa1 [Pseudolycoriella hygida]|uniref:Cytochrome P450 4aa1 n=1 Tax=Pseudolycoriella hygida TaxID=35572 RepID=A0A9Q0S4I6_9DIPT|nr:putative cytochrome P450 4aa1 [Pseudolycoriella hygida]
MVALTFIHQVLETVCNIELWTYSFIGLCGLIYLSRDYLKSLLICLQLDGPKALPFIGNTMLILEKDLLTHHVSPAYKKYGSLARVWVFFLPFFAILDPNDIQTVLSSSKHTEKIFFYKLLHNFLGAGLITSGGEKWQNHRKLLQSSFHANILEKFLTTFIDASEVMITKLNAAPNELNITHFVNNCVIDILNESVLGVSKSNKDELVNMDDSPFRQGRVLIPLRLTRPWLLFDWIYRMTENATAELHQKSRLNSFTREMIAMRRDVNNNSERKCLIDYMIEISQKNPDFTDDDIVDEACTFMLAGQDSVGAAVAFCLFLLAQNPKSQQKCYDEIKDLLRVDDQRPFAMHDIRRMRYLEQCIKETLRLYPSVPLIARKLGESIIVGKHKLPAGSNVLIFPFATHRIEKIYPQPEIFDPNRFATDRVESRHPYAYLPFSAGARNCIGHKFALIEMKTIIAQILRHYRLLPVKGKTKIEPIFRITVRAAGGLWIRLERR